MSVINTCAVIGAVCLFAATEAVYFSQEQPTFCVPSNLSIGTPVGRVFAYTNVRDKCSNKTLLYDVINDVVGFSVNATGWILLNVSLQANDTESKIINVTAQCKTEYGQTLSAYSIVNVNIISPEHISENTNALSPDEVDRLCFYGFPDMLYVEENVKDIVLGRINNCDKTDDTEMTYTINKPMNRFTVSQLTSELSLIKVFNRETMLIWNTKGQKDKITGVQPLRVICELSKAGVKYSPQRRLINVTVIDVNDNPPTFPNDNGVQNIVVDIEVKPDQDTYSINKVVEDKDSWKNGTHSLKVLSDILGVCRSNLTCLNPMLGKTICRLRIDLQNVDKINGTLYHCEVAVIDTEFVPPVDSNINNSATLTVNIHKNRVITPAVLPLKATLEANFYRTSTRLARLMQIDDDKMRKKPQYSLNNGIFKITRIEGIVYLDNETALAASPDTILLRVTQTDGADINVIVHMFGTARNHTPCDEGCSRHATAQSCAGSCGLGLQNGNCVMRGSDKNSRMDIDYGTCTYDSKLCPNRVCDELEDMYHWLCPQDCTTSVNGAFQKNMREGRGIVMAESPCWCESDYYDDEVEDEVAITCNCMPGPNQDSPQQSLIDMRTTSTAAESEKPQDSESQVGYTMQNRITSTDESVTMSDNHTDPGQMSALATEESKTTCDNACGTAIGLGAGAFIAISFSLFMLWFTKNRNDRRKSNLKHVGSVVSMSAVPSDYVEDRERQMSYSSPQWSPKGPIYMSQVQRLQNENIKWEVARENLTLDKTLGEGEFGLVVKAKAVGIDGSNVVKDVAVKMLKHCSTQLEEQDLWSEFNILTDVSHPNVIRLLGACTIDGPFYVIVEYCEHGCLLKYLRRSRLEENGYVNTRIRYKSPNPKEQTDQTLDGDLLSMRDLLSFAWQIAKGMSYLSEIKLVHRDLAARNVLVASGKLLKISDFGLTRDVYEADTYLKKSRGRIPVKWLAPESLYAQIYTTRSDVWSYGIVLWEIVTLGAPPYPGIPPERLYNLLIGGYRMDRPENCPDEMYAVMQKCWKIDAAERPSFASLALIFDRILQEKTGYLDLTHMNGHIPDLYSKCFDADIQDYHIDDSTNTDVESDMTTETADDAIENMNITTVCNKTYSSETYLTPVCTTQPDSELLPPNQGNNLNTAIKQEYTQPTPTRQVENIQSQTDIKKHPSCETVVVILNKRDEEPLFKKKISDNIGSQNSTKCNKNKNVIYPSENLSLLMDNGSARFHNVNETVDDF